MDGKLCRDVTFVLSVHDQCFGSCINKASENIEIYLTYYWRHVTIWQNIQLDTTVMLSSWVSKFTWHGCSDQQLDLTLLLLHGLLEVLEEQPLHVADHLPQEGKRGRDGVHSPLARGPHKIHDKSHLGGKDFKMVNWESTENWRQIKI